MLIGRKVVLSFLFYLVACSAPPSPLEIFEDDPLLREKTPEIVRVKDPNAAGEKTPEPVHDEICRVQKTSVNRRFGSKWRDQIQLPARGRFYVEGHLASLADRFSGARDFPATKDEEISRHLHRSSKILGIPFDLLYPGKWSNVWTPPEGGRAGQGSRGHLKPSVMDEMFLFTMMFARSSKPRPGERWLMSNGSRHVVVVGGYEVGPSIQSRLGGVQAEVLYFLDARHAGIFELHGPLVSEDQDIEAGPIDCAHVQYF